MNKITNEFKKTELAKQVENLVKQLICCYSCCNGVNTVRLTTLERDALDLGNDEGRIIFNVDTNLFEGWTGVVWNPMS